MTLKKRFLKIGAAFLGFLSVFGLLFGALVMYRIPGTENFARGKIVHYLENYYYGCDLEIKEVLFGKTYGEYSAVVCCPENEDIRFTVTCDKNGSCEDSYEEDRELGRYYLEKKREDWAVNLSAAIQTTTGVSREYGGWYDAMVEVADAPAKRPHISPPYREGMEETYSLSCVIPVEEGVVAPEKAAAFFKSFYWNLKEKGMTFVQYNIWIWDASNGPGNSADSYVNPESPNLSVGGFTPEMFEAEDFTERFLATKRYIDEDGFISKDPPSDDPNDYSVMYALEAFWED